MKRRVFLSLLPIVLLCFALRTPFFPEPLDYDEGNYSFYAQQVLRGDGFYSTIWTSRPPLLVLLYTLTYVFDSSSLALRIFSALIGVGSTLMVYKLAKLLFDARTGLFSALIFALFSSNYAIEGARSNAEVFMIFFTITAFYLFFLSQKKKRRSLLVLSGLMVGAAFLVKQVAAFSFLALLLWNLNEFLESGKKIKERLKTLRINFILTASFLVPLIVLVVYFYLTGRFNDFVDFTFLKSISYVGGSHGRNPIWPRLKASWLQIFPSTFVFWLLALGGLVKVLAAKKKLFLVYWTTLATLGVYLGGWFFPHYFIQLVPPLSVLGGVFVAEVFSQSHRFSKKLSLLPAAVFAVLLIISLRPNLDYFPGYLSFMAGKISREEYLVKYKLPLWKDHREAGEYLRQKMKGEEKLFVWGSSSVLYFYAQKPCFYKFGVSHPLLDEKLTMRTVRGVLSKFEANRQELMERLVLDPPDYLVVRAEPEKIFDEMTVFPQFATFVQKNYQFEQAFNELLVYRLKKEPVEALSFDKENPLVPLDLIKRFSAITEIKTEEGQTAITFEPMVNPKGILRSFKVTYSEAVKISFEPISGELLGQDGRDYVGRSFAKPSGVIDLHLKVTGVKRPLSFVRVKEGGKTWNNKSYGVNRPLKVVQKGEIFDLYFEPPLNWQGKVFEVYIIYEDGSLSRQSASS